MTYIINPIWFYLIGVGANVGVALLVIGGILASLAGIIFFGALTSGYDLDDSVDSLKRYHFKTFIILSAIFLILGLAIPDKETSYTMLAASALTQENIDYAIETGKDIVDYVLEITEESMDLTAEEGSEKK